MVGEEPDTSNPFATFKCFVDQSTKDFFIEINQNTPIKYFTRTTLFNLLDCAEQEEARNVFVCFSKDTQDLENSLKTFLFVGFQVLDEKEKAIASSFTQTHFLLKYSLSESSDDESEEADF